MRIKSKRPPIVRVVNSYKDLWKKGSVRPVGPEACNGKG